MDHAQVESQSSVSVASGEASGAPFGIGAFNFGPGNISVTTASGSTITSGSSGIDAVNEATTTAGHPDPIVSVSAAGTISAGTILTNSGAEPSGIAAGFFGGASATPNQNISGTVIVNNAANINASNATPSSYGINAFNYGQGNVTVGDAANTTVIGALDGISAAANSGGAGNVAVSVDTGSAITGSSSYGIVALNTGEGNVSVLTSSGDAINSGSAGIVAVDDSATAVAGNSIVVNAAGSIHSGSAVLSGSGNIAAGIVADYNSGLADNPDNNVDGNISITNFASIVAAAGTDGIRGDNYGEGTVTIVAEAGAVITAGRYGIGAFGYDGGDISVANYATVSGTTAAIDATTTAAGTATIENFGSLAGDVLSYNASFTNEAGGDWSLDGTSAFTGTSSLVNLGAIQSNGVSEISGLLSLEYSGTIEVQSGTLKVDTALSGAGKLTIDSGATLEITSAMASGQTVVFSSTTGMLKLDHAETFNGLISGFSGTSEANSDQVDLVDINFNSSKFSEQFNSATDSLSVSDGTNTAVVQFTGTVGALNFVADGNPINGVTGTRGTLVYDPPATSQSVGSMIMHDPGPATSATIATTAPNQTLSGFAASDNFVFNFAQVGHATVTNFNPSSDTIQFANSLFANVQAILNAAQDDGHGDTVTAIDGHDSIALTGVTKSQLHIADFHIV